MLITHGFTYSKYILMKSIFALLLLLISFQLMAQVSTERVYSDDFSNFSPGIYKLKSTDSIFLSNKYTLIEAEKELRQTDRTDYLVVDKQPVVLFKNSSPKSVADVAGILTESSLVENIRVYYKKTYRDFSKEWWITHEVWKEIEINGQVYFTDVQLHSLISYSYPFIAKNQVLLFVAKSTGYDGNYDVGYPENWHLLAIDEHNQIVFDSGKLDFVCNCEFGIEQLTYNDKDELVRQISDNMVEVRLHGSRYDKETKEFMTTLTRFTWDGSKIEYPNKN